MDITAVVCTTKSDLDIRGKRCNNCNSTFGYAGIMVKFYPNAYYKDDEKNKDNDSGVKSILLCHHCIKDRNDINSYLRSTFKDISKINYRKMSIHEKKMEKKDEDLSTTIKSALKLKECTDYDPINKLYNLKPNWDGYESMPFSEDHLTLAKLFYAYLGEGFEVFPTGNSSIQFEKEDNDRYIEFELYPDGRIKMFSKLND